MGPLAQESAERDQQEFSSQAGILGVETPDLVRPWEQRTGNNAARRDEGTEEGMEPDHQHEAFWRALEPFGPEEASGQETVQASSETVKEDEPGHEGEWSGARAKASAVPQAPTRKDLEEHLITHWPFRNWCDHCVRGR